MMFLKWMVIILLIPLCKTDEPEDDSSVTEVSENVIVSSSEAAPSLKSQLTKEFFKRRRRRKPLEGFLLDSSAARSAKNTTAVEIIMQKIRRAQESKKKVYHDPLSQNRARKRLIGIPPKVPAPTPPRSTVLPETTAPMLVTNEKLMAIEAAAAAAAAATASSAEDEGPFIKGPLAATDFGKRLKEISTEKRFRRRPGLRYNNRFTIKYFVVQLACHGGMKHFLTFQGWAKISRDRNREFTSRHPNQKGPCQV